MSRLNDLLSRLQKVRRFGSTWRAVCPSHTDKTPSLVIKVDNKGNLLLHCFAGCDVPDVMGALGLPMHFLFANNDKPARMPGVPTTVQVLARHRRRLAAVTRAIRSDPRRMDELREKAMEIACDHWEAAEKFVRETYASRNCEWPPHCWWQCLSGCNYNYEHKEGCGGCNKTARKIGLCWEHFAAYSKPFRRRA